MPSWSLKAELKELWGAPHNELQGASDTHTRAYRPQAECGELLEEGRGTEVSGASPGCQAPDTVSSSLTTDLRAPVTTYVGTTQARPQEGPGTGVCDAECALQGGARHQPLLMTHPLLQDQSL